MFVNYKKLKKLPVITESGQKLGFVYDMKIDIDSHIIQLYFVRLGILNKQTYLIKPAQILSITENNILVQDGVIKEKIENIGEEICATKVFANVSQTIEE